MNNGNKIQQNVLIKISQKTFHKKTTKRKGKTQHSEELTCSPFKNLKKAEEE